MNRLEMTRAEFDAVMRLCRGPIACNRNGKVFRVTGYGRTPEADRVYLQGKLKLLDRVVDECLVVYPNGGRIYLSEDGAFRELGNPHAGEGRREQFLAFDLR